MRLSADEDAAGPPVGRHTSRAGYVAGPDVFFESPADDAVDIALIHTGMMPRRCSFECVLGPLTIWGRNGFDGNMSGLRLHAELIDS